MPIPIVAKAFLGCLIGLYALFNGWMILRYKRVYIPAHINVGLWLARKIYGNAFAKQEREKFIKNQLSQGWLLIIVGVIILFFSLFPLVNP